MSHDVSSIEDLLRESAPRVLGAVVRRFGDFAEAEDMVQEALLAAAERWPEGTPENPVGWLIHVASVRMIDRLRSNGARYRREQLTAAQEARRPERVSDADDTLLLMFMCCHPALSEASAIALTLRAVGGLTTAEIAHAFLVPEPTMAQRISRAKQSVKASGVPFAMPDEKREARLRSVLHVLYLIFNEGYLASSGEELARCELSSEAIRLTRIAHLALPEDPEVAGSRPNGPIAFPSATICSPGPHSCGATLELRYEMLDALALLIAVGVRSSGRSGKASAHWPIHSVEAFRHRSVNARISKIFRGTVAHAPRSAGPHAGRLGGAHVRLR